MKKLTILALFFVLGIFLLSCNENKKLSNIKLSKTQRLIYYGKLEYLKTRDPNTLEVPPNIKSREMAFVRGIQSKEEYHSMLRMRGQSEDIETQDWNSRGPWNTGGRYLCLAIDINNENIINAGSASGGMWRSLDGGKSWMKTGLPNSNQNISCIVQDKRQGKTNIWYHGTGELLSTTDRKFSLKPRNMGLGGGIYKSTDNGTSWYHLKSTSVNTLGILAESFQSVWNIVTDATTNSEDIIYAACFGSILRSSDGGDSWTSVLGDLKNKSFSSDIVISSKGILYAALSRISSNSRKPSVTGIWRSVNGLDWVNITPIGFPDTTKVIRLALAPSNEDVLYVLTERPRITLDAMSFFTGSYHSFWKYNHNSQTNSGTWQNRSSNLPNSTQGLQQFNSLGGYCLTLIVKPDDENTVFLGGTSFYRSINGFSKSSGNSQIGGYYRNGGYDITNQYLHPDIHAMAFLPSDSKKLMVASDGGIHKTDNCLEDNPSWYSLNNGLLGSQFYTIALDHSNNDDFLFGGLQDNGSQFTFTNRVEDYWMTPVGGDGMAAIVADNKKFILGSWYSGNFVSFRFDKNNNVIDGMYIRPEFLNDGMFEFYTNFALDPNNNKTFYLPAKNKLWRKDNIEAATYDTNQIETGWTELTQSALPDGESITCLSVSKIPANRLYFGSVKGNLFRLDDANIGDHKPINITGSNFPKNGFLACVEPDPHNADNIFAIFSNYNVLSIFYSTDGGKNWSSQGGNLEENPDGSGAGPSIRWIKCLHSDNGTIYFAGTSSGLFSTTKLEGDKTIWVQEGKNIIGNLTIDMIDCRESDGTVVIATQGGGVFSTKLKVLSAEENKIGKDIILVDNYPNPATNYTNIQISVGFSGLISLELYDINGRKALSDIKRFYEAGTHTIHLDLFNLKAGTYFYRLTANDLILTKKIIITGK